MAFGNFALLAFLGMVLHFEISWGAKLTQDKRKAVELEKLSAIVETLQETIADQQKAISSLQNDLYSSRAIQLQQAKEIRDMTYRVSDLQLHSVPLHRQPSPETTTETMHACLFEVLNMVCPPNNTLFIVKAFYGQYATECNTEVECCEPDVDNDCYGVVQDVDPEGWLALRVDCNYKNVCEYQYQGSPNTGCGAVLADYLTVEYACVSDEQEADLYEYVGFTFGSAGGYHLYNALEPIQFPRPVTNIGNHFSNSTFTVPYKGLYMFSLNLNTDDDDDEMNAEIMRNNAPLVYAFADGINPSVHTAFFQASNLVIAECEVGDIVWVRCAVDSNQLYDPGNSIAPVNTFSGALLHRLE